MGNQGIATECLATWVNSHHHILEVRTNNFEVLILCGIPNWLNKHTN